MNDFESKECCIIEKRRNEYRSKSKKIKMPNVFYIWGNSVGDRSPNHQIAGDLGWVGLGWEGGGRGGSANTYCSNYSIFLQLWLLCLDLVQISAILCT